MGILRHILEAVGVMKREKKMGARIIQLRPEKGFEEKLKETGKYEVRVPGNIRRQMIGSKAFKEERDDDED